MYLSCRETEKRAQSAEEKAFLAESSLKDAEEKIRALERTLQKMEAEEKETIIMLNNNLSEAKSEINVPSLTAIPSFPKSEVVDVPPQITSSPDKESNLIVSTEIDVIVPSLPSLEVTDSKTNCSPSLPENVHTPVDGECTVASSLCSISPTLLHTSET
jgi:hypothetical protein